MAITCDYWSQKSFNMSWQKEIAQPDLLSQYQKNISSKYFNKKQFIHKYDRIEMMQ